MGGERRLYLCVCTHTTPSSPNWICEQVLNISAKQLVRNGVLGKKQQIYFNTK